MCIRDSYIPQHVAVTFHEVLEHFFYFKVKINGKWVRLNVAKEVTRRDNGYIRIKYFLYLSLIHI